MSGITLPVEARLKYLRRRQDEISKIKDSWSTQTDWDLAKKVGHQIKGNATTFEFALFTPMGQRLEEAAERKNNMELQLCVEELEALVLEALRELAPA